MDPTSKKTFQRPRSDPNGFLVLTECGRGEFHVVWCKTDSGAEISKRNAHGLGKCHIIPVSDLLSWRQSGADELEAMFKL